MNILIVAEAYPPDEGGVATSTARIANALAAAGCSVIVATYDHERGPDFTSPQRVESDGPVTLMRIGPLLVSAGKDAASSARHKALLRRRFVASVLDTLEDLAFSPEIIFSMYLLNAGFLATFLAKRLKIPHVAGIRGNDIGRNLFDPGSLHATGFVLEHADAVVSVNAYLRERMLEAFPAHEAKTTVINNTIGGGAVLERAPSRKRILELTGWPPTALILCFNGSFREKKGALEILAALDRLTEESSEARLLIVGGTLGQLERAAAGPTFDRLVAQGIIAVAGKMEQGAVTEFIAGGDILIMPSLDDGLANALLEGMRAGLCPLVSSIFEDVLEPGRTGYVLDRVTPAKIADAIRSLDKDRDAAMRMGRSAQQASLAWMPEVEGRAYLSLFERLLAAGDDRSARA